MTETTNQIFEYVTEIIGKDNIQPEMSLKEDLGLDSIKMVTIITKMSTKFRINIFDFSDRDLVQMKTVNDVIELFDKKISG